MTTKLTTQSLLQNALGDSARTLRNHFNSMASKTMARFTVLLFVALAFLIMMTFSN